MTEESPEELALQAARCRRLAGATYNREMSDMLGTMADEYQRAAQERSAEAAPSAPPPPAES